MEDQTASLIMILGLTIIIFGTGGGMIYLYFTGPKRLGVVRTSATIGLVAGLGSFAALSASFILLPSPSNNLTAALIFALVFSLILGLILFIGMYLNYLAKGFSKELVDRMLHRKRNTRKRN